MPGICTRKRRTRRIGLGGIAKKRSCLFSSSVMSIQSSVNREIFYHNNPVNWEEMSQAFSFGKGKCPGEYVQWEKSYTRNDMAYMTLTHGSGGYYGH